MNPYRQAREVENDALARMTEPSPKEIGWDEGYAAGLREENAYPQAWRYGAAEERERSQAMNALLSEQLEEARRWHLAAVNEKRAAQADAERLFTALDGYIMARITGTDLREYDDLAERAARAHRRLADLDESWELSPAATPDPSDGCECCGDEAAQCAPGECCDACRKAHERLPLHASKDCPLMHGAASCPMCGHSPADNGRMAAEKPETDT